jgi:hypothetical protein
MSNQTKRIEWSYPTSPNADKFGFKDGCWCVEIVTNGLPRAVNGFATLEEASAKASAMPLPWDRFTKSLNS